MAQNIALQTLIEKKERLISEKQAANSKFDDQINDIDAAIDQLYGKETWVISENLFDDTNPDYIKASQEEI